MKRQRRGGSSGTEGVRKRRRQERAYVPQYRSGGYALLVAMHEFGPEYQANKDELVEVAEKHSTKSFRVRSFGERTGTTDFYSAWSSMSILVKKGLVGESWQKRPRRKLFHLTESGSILAAQLAANHAAIASADAVDLPVPSSRHCFPGGSTSQRPAVERLDLGDSSDGGGTDTGDEEEAEMHISVLAPRGGGHAGMVGVTRHTDSWKQSRTDGESSTTAKAGANVTPRKDRVASLTTTPTSLQHLMPSTSTWERRRSRPQVVRQRPSPSDEETRDSSGSGPDMRESQRQTSQPCSTQTHGTHQGASQTSELARLLREHWRSVVLLADTREQTPGQRQLPVSAKLCSGGITCYRRNLIVGDYVWAVEKGRLLTDDMVLGCIVERKTLNDLKHSIRDGRFKEQLLRLQNTSLRVVYVIEGALSEINPHNIDEKSLATATSELRLAGICVHRTRDVTDTVTYLQTMHAAIQQQVQQGLVTTAFPFKQFQQDHVHSNKLLTTGGLWARMLIQIPGLGLKRAKAIADRYPTVDALMQAYWGKDGRQPVGDGDAEREAEDAKLLQDLRADATAQRVGPRMSSTIYSHFTCKAYTPQ
mmetsp:Transcript_30704/g.86044  ORF Transcript_30704/g.86044 Transcript_30704/m.86044 type:complete len:591 (+) Transcript_30704:57-1829(+)